MASIKLVLNKQRMLKNGTYPLVFQIIQNRRKRLLYTEFRIAQEEFDESSGRVKLSEKSAMTPKEVEDINKKLKREYSQLQKHAKDLESKKCEFSVDDIVASNSCPRVPRLYLLKYFDLQIESKRKIGKEGIAIAYVSTQTSLKKYLEETFAAKTDVLVSEIRSIFVEGYEEFLYSKGLSENTVNYYLRNFRTIYNRAIRTGIKSEVEYPFSYVHTRPCRTIKRALTRENMKQLNSLSLVGFPNLELSRDLYLFSFFAQGMAFVDIIFIKKEDISGGILSYYRHKSKQLINIVVTPQMQSLINKYQNASEYIFPIIDHSTSVTDYAQYRLALGKINRYLKKIALMLNIDVKLTTYTARHTWATLARDSGAPIAVISTGLGHTSEKITRIYLKEFDTDILAQVNSIVTNLL